MPVLSADIVQDNTQAGAHGVDQIWIMLGTRSSLRSFHRAHQVLRLAWDMLLTERYTLEEICEELDSRGYTRASGRPWAWTDQKNGTRMTAKNRLHNIFHNPFYAGWVVSERFGIAYGEIRGKWESIITTEEFERGHYILRKHGDEKSRFKRQFYLLRSLLYVKMDDKHLKMFGSTPSGRSRSYPYYITHAKPEGKKIHISCEVVDDQIPRWLGLITVEPILVPAIRNLYTVQLKNSADSDRGHKIAEFKHQLSRLKNEEARLGRLLISDKISEETYDELRREWQEKQRNIEINIADLERDAGLHLDDLELALVLMTQLSNLFSRFSEKERAILLQILAKKIIVNLQGEIVDQELNSPFAYLHTLADEIQSPNSNARGSDQIPLGAQRNRQKSAIFCFVVIKRA
jgi:hypothetical protein